MSSKRLRCLATAAAVAAAADAARMSEATAQFFNST
jgi:hypothetical protein